MIDQTDIKRPLRNVTALVKVIFAIKASIFLMLNEKINLSSDFLVAKLLIEVSKYIW